MGLEGDPLGAAALSGVGGVGWLRLRKLRRLRRRDWGQPQTPSAGEGRKPPERRFTLTHFQRPDFAGLQGELTKCMDYAFVIDMKSGGGELWGRGWDRRPAGGSVKAQRRGFRLAGEGRGVVLVRGVAPGAGRLVGSGFRGV